MTRRAVSRLPIAVRPGRGRAASACGAAAFLLSGLVAFLLTAAGSERGAAGQSYVASVLGAPTTTASLVRQPARGTRVAIGHSGYAVSHGSYTLTLDSQQLGRSRWQRFENGAARRTAFGSVAITVDPLKTEELLTVDRHLGPRTWRWRLGDGTLELHARADGSVDVPARGRVPGFEILPVEILDRAGRQITPAGLRWSLAKHGGSSWLELRLDDSQLPRPYVIDPATITLRTPTTATTGGAAAGSLSVAMPTGTAYDDLMIAQITVGGGSGTAITPPSGWTLLRRDDNGTNVSTALYTHVAGAGEAGPYQWSFSPNAVAAGGILAYAGVDQSVALQTSGGTGGSNKNMVAPAITTTSANEKVIDFNGALTSGKVTAPTGSTPTFTEEYDPQATFDIEAADGTYASAASTGTKTAVASSNTYWVSQLVGLTLDTTLPTNAYSLVNVSPTGNAYLSGTTLWYKGNNGGGSFHIETAVTDTGSGPNSANYPNLGGTTTGWTHTGGNITAPAGGPYDSNAFTWANNTVSSPTETITSKDNATNKTANYVITFTNDTTAPNADGSIAFTGLTGTGSVYSPSTTLSLSLADGTDSGSGVDTSNEVLQRASATLSSANGLADGTCGTFGSFSTIATDTSSTFTDDAADGIQSGHCYRYQFIVSDHVGNTRTYTSSDVKVDATAPTTPSLTITPVSGTAYEHVSGTQIYYNPNGSNSGSFNVDASDASVSDADSGITKVSFPALPGFTGGGDDTTPTPWRGAYSWTNASTTSPGAQTVTETNNATGASTAGFTVTKDATAPSTTDNTASIGSAWRNTNATVTLTPSDSGAGVAATYYTTDGSTPTTSSAQGTTINLTADGTYTIKYFSVDRVGNSEPVETASTQIRIDKTSPTASTLSALPAAIENGQTLSASATDGGPSGIASVAYYECPGTSCTPSTLIGSSSAGPNYSLTWSSQPADGSYQVLARASDAAGNTLDSAKQTVTVDNTAPSVTQTDPGANLRGTVSIGATASDGGGSGIATVALQRSPAGAGTWATIGTASSTPYSVSFDTTAVSDGLYDFRAIATDNAGNQTTSATVTSRRVDNTAPTATMGNPGANVRGTVTLTSTTSDSGSGVASIAYEYSPTGAATWTATPSSWNTTLVGDGLYDLRVIAVDAAGNQTTSAAVINVRVDNTAPATSLTDPGANLSSTATLAATGTDTGGSGVASVAFQYSPAGAGTWTTISTDATSPYSASWNTSGVGDGLYDLRTVATDNAGNQTPSTVVTSRRVDNTSPTGSLTAPTAAANLTGTVTVTSNSADAGSGVAAALFQYSPAGAGIWTTIASDSSAPYSVSWDTTGVADGSYDLRVTTTDNAANTFANTITVVVDNQAPGKPSLSFGSFTNAFQTGSTVYFRPGASGGFTVTGTSTSGPSGIASLVFPASIGSGWAGGGVDSSSPFQGVYTFGGAAPAEPANLHVTATSGAGLTSVQSDPFSLVADATAPATTILCGGAACASGWYTSGVVVSMSATDGGSGVDRIRYTTDGSTPDYSTNGTTYSSPLALTSNTTLKVRAFDNVGNAEAVQTLVLQIDTNPPTVSIASPSAGGAVANGATLTASAADADSGVADVQLGYCPGSSCTWGSGGFTTIGSLLTSAPYRVTWSGQPADGTYTLLARAHDDVGNVTVSSPVTVTVDNTAPAAAMGNPGANVRGTVALSSTTSDAGSGISTVVYQYSPSGAGSWTATPSGWDTTALADGLYDLRATATDNAGNQTTSANAVTVRVDNTPPITSLTNPGANVRGTVALSSSTSDAGSGVASVAFQRSPAGAGSWTTIGTDATAPYSLSFDTTGVADGQYDLRTVASDAAGNQTASAVVTSRVDNTAPAAAMGNPGANVRGTVALSSTTSDAGSGISTVVYQYSPSGAGSWTATASSWDTTALADGLYDLRATATDNAGNQTTSANAVTVRVDNTPPTGSLTDPGPSLAATVPLSATGADAGSGVASVAFQRSPAGAGSWTTIGTDATAPYSLSFDTTGVADGQYDLRAVVTDAAGNQTATAVIASRRIDNTAPTGSLTAPAAGAAVAGSSVLVSSSSADGGSGVALVAFQRSPHGAGTWTTIGTAVGSPYQVTWDTTGVADGLYDLRVVTTDGAGNQTTSATVANVRVDNTAPTATMTSPGANVRSTITLGSTTSDAGSGVASTVYQWSPAGLGTWTSLAGTSWDTTGVTDGLYDLRVIATDNAGNQTTSAAVTNVRVDNTAPTATMTSPGANVRGTITLGSTTSDSGSGVASVQYQYSTAGAGSWNNTAVAWNTTLLSDGLYDLRVIATDGAGNQTASVKVSNVRVDNTAPTVSMAAPSGSLVGTVTLASTPADGGSGIQTVTFQISPNGQSSWSTIGTSSASPWSLAWDSTTVSDGRYDFRAVAADKAGNTTTSALVASKQVMNHPPTVSITAPGLYVNASAPNPFTITATTTTANGATVSSVQFFRCSDASVNCATGSYVSLGTDTTSPYTVSWALDAEGNRALEAIVTDSHGSTGQDVVNTLIDLTPPSGTSISYGNGYDNTGSVAIATGNGSDSGSGINTVSGVIQRDSATLANGACGSWNGSWTTVSNPDTTVASTTCYRYRYTVSDLAGNSTTATSTNAVREDSFAPTVSLGAIGTNLRGTVSLTATAADTGGSGMASVTFQRSPTGAGTWTTIGTATGASPYSLDFDTTAAADGVYDFRAVAADAAGNQTASTLATGKRIDNTAPSVTLTSPGAVVRTTVSLSASASDGGSGLASTVYQYSPAGAGAWTTTPASWDTTLRADGLYDVRAVATDLAGNSASSTVTNVRIDNTAPTVTLGDPGANLRGNVSLAATAADSGGSGIASVAFQRSPAGAGTWTTIGTATGPFSLSFDTTSAADGVYDLRAIATDTAGNQTTSAVVTSRLVDNTAPTGSLTAPANGAKLAGASVTVAASSADAGSGVASVVFQRSPAGAGTWTAIGTATSSPYQRSWDTTAVADGNYDLRAVTTDAAGNSFTSATTTVTVDNTAPPAPTLSFGSFSNAAQSGSTIYYRPGTSGAFTVTGTGSGGASGIDHFTFPSLGSGWSGGGGVSSAPYQAAYSYNGTPAQPGGGQTVTYANGAGTTSAVSNPFAVVADSTAPTSAITCNGGPCSGWYPGPVTVALSANDAGSGLDRIRYTTNGVDPDYSTTGTTYIATFVVGSTATVKYRAFDNVGNAEPVRSQVIQIDAVAPTGSLTAPADGTSAAGTLTVASSSADTGGSGVDAAVFQRSPAGAGTWTTIGTATASPYAVSWNTTALTDGSYDLRVVTTDAAGNQTTSAIRTVLVDNTAPTATMASPGAHLRGTVSLGSATSDSGSGIASIVYQSSPAGTGTWTSLPGFGWDTTGVADGLYDLRVVATDAAGNTTASAPITNVFVDNTPPTAAMGNPGANVRGTVALSSTTSDAGSGVATVAYAYSPSGAGTWTATPSSWDTTALADGPYDLRVVVTDNAGNQTTSAALTGVRVDNTAPTVTLADPGAHLADDATLTVSTTESGSGIASVAYQRSPAGAGTWTTIATATAAPFSAVWDTTTVADGNYDLRAVATDRAGNTTTSSSVTGVEVDNTAPDVTLASPVDGSYVNAASPDPLTVTATTTSSDVANVQFYACDDTSTNCTTGNWVSLGVDSTAPYSASLPLPADGNLALLAIATDDAGNTQGATSNVTVDRTAPTGGSVTYASGYHSTAPLTITTDDGSDATSGLDASSAVLERDSAPLANGTCGSWAGSWSTVSTPDVTLVAGHCYRYRYRIADVAGNVATYTSSNAVTVPGAPVALAVLGTPSGGVTAGSGFSVVVAALDANGNPSPVGSDTGIVLAPSGSGILSGGASTITAGTSSATLTGVAYTKAEPLTLVARRTSGAALADSGPSGAIAVVAAPASRLGIASVNGGSNPVAGSGFPVVVRALDPYGNVSAPSQATTITLTRAAGTGTLGGTTTGSLSGGSLTIAGVTYSKAEPGVALTASASGGDSLTAATSSPFTVAAVATRLVVTQVNHGADPTAGAAFSVVVQAQDANGNAASVAADTGVALTLATGSGTLGGTLSGTIAAGSGSVTIAGVTYSSAESGVSLTATRQSGDALSAGTSAPFAVGSGSATSLVVTTAAGSPQTAGQPFDVTVTAHDAQGNVATGYAGEVDFSSSDGRATLPASYTFVAGDHGVHTFSAGAALGTAGSQTITANDHTNGSITGSAPVTVAAASVSAAVSTVHASSPTVSTDAGNSGTITVTVEDAFGNPIAGANVTLAANGGSSSISPPFGTTTNGAGIATFTVADGTAEAVTYSATASGTLLDQSAGVTFQAGAADHLAFLVQPSNVGAGQAMTPAVEVEVLDAHGNRTASTAAVTLTKDAGSPSGTLAGGGAVSAVAGVATFAGLSIDQAGTGFSLDASGSGLTGATSRVFDVVPAPDLAFSGVTGAAYHPAGTNTVYVRAAGSGSFTVTATPAGKPSYSFPALGSGWSPAGGQQTASNSVTYSFASGAADPGDETVTYLDGGTTSGAATLTVHDDSTAPTGGTISVPGLTNSTSVSIAKQDFTDAGAGIASNVITRSDPLAPSAGACPASGYSGSTVVASPDTVPAGDRCYLYTLTGTDRVGNVATAVSSPVLVEITPPALQSAAVNGTSLTLTYDKALGTPAPAAGSFTVTYDGGSQSIAGTAVSGHSVVLTMSSAPRNSETVSVAYAVPTHGEDPIVDTAGNQAGALAATAVTNTTADTVAPGAVVDTPAASAYTNQTAVTYTFHATRSSGSTTAESGDTFKCALDGAAFAACTSPYTASLLPDGAHTLHVKAVDAAGNLGAAADSVAITVDTVAPQVDATSSPSSPTNVANHAVFEFDSTDANNASVTFQCKLDGGSFAACTSGYDFVTSGTLADGPHTATIRATDGAGNHADATDTWTVDTTPPTVTAISTTTGDGSYGAGTTIHIRATFSENVNVDTTGGTPTLTLNTTPARSAAYVSGSGTSTLTFDYTVQAGDNTAGNLDTTALALDGGTIRDAATNPATLTLPAGNSLADNKSVVVDTTPPAAPTVTSPANGGTTGAVATVFVSGEAGATLACSLDGGGAGACPTSLSGLSAGSHTLGVTATDAAGNTSPATAVTWTVDLTPPAITITGPADPTPATSATFTLASNKPGTTAVCALDPANPDDASAYSPCSSPQTYNGLNPGQHSFYVIGTDAYGNTSAPQPYNGTSGWTVDVDPPAISGPPDPSNQTSPSISFSMAEPGWTFRCSLDGAPTSACTSPTTVGPLSDSSHTFSVTARDANGNASATSSSTWTVDTHVPGQPTITSGPSNPSGDGTPSFTFTGDPGSTFLCSVDSGTFAACTSPYTTSALADGSHTFQVEQVSAAGSTSAATTYGPWTMDATAPAAPTISSGPANPTTATSATLAFAPSDPSDTNLTFECDLDGAGFAACVSPDTFVSLPAGIHVFSVRPTDAAGNTGPAATYSWSIGVAGGGGGGGGGANPPHVVSESPADGSTVASVGPSVSVTFDRSVQITQATLQPPTGAPVSLPNATATTWTIPYSATAPGLYTLSATISDGIAQPTKIETHFTIWVVSSGTAVPAVSETAYAAGSAGSLRTADSQLTAAWPAAAIPADGMVITITPQPTVSAPADAAFASGSTPLDVTARTLLTRQPVTTFAAPIEIDFPNASPDDVPAVSTDGGATWRYLLPVAGPSLPPGTVDGYTQRPGGGVSVYTMHLTLYALLTNKQGPSAPNDLGAGIDNGQLVLRWNPATSVTGCIASYSVQIDGATVKTLGGQTFEYDVGPATSGDTHVYRVLATDCSGRGGSPSYGFTGVPSLVGMTEQQASAALQAAGFAVGVVTNIGSGQRVTAQSPAAPAYAIVGSPVDFTLGLAPATASGPLRTPLSVHVVGSRRINPAVRHYVAIRIQMSRSSQVTSTLRDPQKRILGLWTRVLRAGTFIIRYQLPTNLPPAHYRLTVVAVTDGSRRAYTIPVTIRPGRAPLVTRPRVVVVGDGTGPSNLKLDLKSPAEVQVASDAHVFDVTGASASVAAIVVDVDRHGVNMVHNLHIVFPSVKIVAITDNASRATRARRYGASAVVLGSSGSLGRRVSEVVDRLTLGAS